MFITLCILVCVYQSSYFLHYTMSKKYRIKVTNAVGA